MRPRHCILQHQPGQSQQSLRPVDVVDRATEFPAVLTPRQAQAFIPCSSLKATYEWLRRHGIVRRGNGSVDRRDLQRELDRLKRKPRRVMHPNSLRNLRTRVG